MTTLSELAAVLRPLSFGLLAVVLAGCSATPVSGSAVPDPVAVSAIAAQESANRQVCSDLDARGGALYSVFVVPMLTGATGRKSIDVDIAQFTRAVDSIQQVGRSTLEKADGDIAQEGRQMVAAAESMGVYDHAEGTALLTAFVGLAVACTKADQQPSWFDPVTLAAN